MLLLLALVVTTAAAELPVGAHGTFARAAVLDPSAKPHVLFVVCDDLRPQASGMQMQLTCPPVQMLRVIDLSDARASLAM